MTITTTSSGQLATSDEIVSLLSHFPPGITHAIGYGSGVFAQNSTTTTTTAQPPPSSSPMLDLILVINTPPLSFHTLNLKQNPHHYSPIASLLGPRFVSRVQTDIPAKVYFNPLVPSPVVSSGRQIKYGVVHISHLLKDLEEWEYLYLAGRMHKPILTGVPGYTNDEVMERQSKNVMSALAASLLLLDPKEQEHQEQQQRHDDGKRWTTTTTPLDDVFYRIANISYAGDVRMMIRGEDPLKVSKLISSEGQPERFRDMYRDSLKELELRGLLRVDWKRDVVEGDFWRCEDDDVSSTSRRELQRLLPLRFRDLGETGCGGGVVSAVGLAGALRAVVGPAARYQSMKGLVTAGLGRSLIYAGEKFAKGWGKR